MTRAGAIHCRGGGGDEAGGDGDPGRGGNPGGGPRVLAVAARGCADEEGAARGCGGGTPKPAGRKLGAGPMGLGTSSVTSKKSRSAGEEGELRSAYGKTDSSKTT
jgi:hypothetical protein